MDVFRVVGLFGGSITQLACCDVPSLGCEKGAMDRRRSGERGPWRHDEAGLCHAFPPDAPSPASLPLHRVRLPEVSQLRSVFRIITTIIFQKCNCGSIPPNLDLLPRISALCQALCLGWGDPDGKTQSRPSGSRWSGRRSSLGNVISSITLFPHCMGPPLAARPGCCISALSSRSPASASSPSLGAGVGSCGGVR